MIGEARRAVAIVAALMACLGLASCVADSLTPRQDAALRAVVVLVRQGRLAEAEARFDPSYARADLDKTLRSLAEVIPPQAPTSVRLLNARSLSTRVGDGFLGTYEYAYPDRLLIVRVGMIAPANAPPMINTFFVDVAPMSVVRANAFTLADKSAVHYAFLAMAAASPLLILVALLSLAGSLRVGGKLFWALGMVVGLGAATINWTTGSIGLRPIFADLFGVSVMHADSLAAPWLISASLPVVALIYLGLRLAGWPRPRRTLPAVLDLPV